MKKNRTTASIFAVFEQCTIGHYQVLLLLLPAGSAAGSSAGISFTHGPILGFFASQGRHVAPIKVKFGREELGP